MKAVKIISGIVVGGIAAYFLIDLINSNQKKQFAKSKDKESVFSDNLTEEEMLSNAIPNSNDNFPMKVGMYGARVAVLQQALNKLGENLTVDGKFGNKTYDAVRKQGGFSIFNVTCRVTYGCSLSYDDWLKITAKAVKSGFNMNTAWTNAKKLYAVKV